MTILNLTQHNATPEQREQSVVEPEDKQRVKQLLTFDNLPTADEIAGRAEALAAIAAESGAEAAMIGGAPYLMADLETALKVQGVRPVYAFSKREVVETTQPDGTVLKKTVFRHLGFVEK